MSKVIQLSLFQTDANERSTAAADRGQSVESSVRELAEKHAAGRSRGRRKRTNAAQVRYEVVMQPIECDDLPRRLLSVYELARRRAEAVQYGETTNAVSTGHADDVLIRDAETDSDGTG